jgi:penicillin-binding protein 1A
MLRQIPLVQGALVTVEPGTGRVLAMSGGWSFDQSQFNRATQANRQPGSSFKPMVYLTAMEQGISPSQRFLDAPFVLDMGAAGKWRPSNYELDFNGPTPLRIALEKSLNLVTVRVADRVGMEQVAQTAIAFHVVDAMPRVLPAALGAVDTTVLRQAGAYAALDAGGKEVVPSLIDSVQDRDGHVIWRAPAFSCQCADPSHPPVLVDGRKEIADAPSVFQVVTMMQGVVSRGTGYEAGKGMNRQVAGKTGTSQDFNDAWFVGFTPDLVTAVWIGFDNPSSLGKDETGGVVAGPIWHDYMTIALKNRPNLKFIPPAGVTMASWDSGFGTVTDAFKPDQQPGASEAIGGTASADAGDAAGGGGTAAGVDTGLGGLY